MSLIINGIALVTGAGSGIGRDCALAYAAEGAQGVVFADLNLESAQAAASSSIAFATNPQYSALALRVDVADLKSVEEMVAKAVATFGRIDYSVNSAGVGVREPREVAEASIEEFDLFWRVNVRGVLHCVQAVSKVMKQQSPITIAGRNGPRDVGRGVIINLGSCNSYVATHHIVQYTTSKHAVLGLTRNAALDNAVHGIRVNAICPSWVETPMIEAAVAGNPELGRVMERVVPLGRIAKTEEISDIIMFLSSPRASYVTGVGWLVDGGATLQMQT
ncbi:MAG: hypothetical protein Q9187_000156 [Circinaria calcarea]